ncbi:MAG: HAMP domain-containing histidine kinase [Lachnospiraceae bacterium]|jgi:signal transduction histidine kinase|nr:HAMP domain-containing histidine kinase [Lachnospiraceae bacterium]
MAAFFRKYLSIRVVFVLLLLFAGVVPLLVQELVLVDASLQSLVDGRMENLSAQLGLLGEEMSRTGYLDGSGPDAGVEGELRGYAQLSDGRILLVGSDLRVVWDTLGKDVGKTVAAGEVIRCFLGENLYRFYKDQRFYALTVPIYGDSPEHGVAGVLLVTASAETLLKIAKAQNARATFLLIVVFSAILLLGLWGAAAFLRPFGRLQSSLGRIAEGHLDEKIRVGVFAETRGIGIALERMLERLRSSDELRDEFVSNVSHELKTPITSIRVLADSLMAMDDAPVELYREFMSDISDEIDRESKIIDDLLNLVISDQTGAQLDIEPTDIGALAKLALKRLRPVADESRVELIFESIREVRADVDEGKTMAILSNLVENAIKYNRPGGFVRVTVDADHKHFLLKVADNGIGIPEEHQGQIFERFYRVDKARSRESGGTGLGLSIARDAVLMMKGTITVQSNEGEGTTFTVRIPLTYAG